MANRQNLSVNRQGKPNVKLAPELTRKILQTLGRILVSIGKPLYLLLSGIIIAFLSISYWLGRSTRIFSVNFFKLLLVFIAFIGHTTINLVQILANFFKLIAKMASEINYRGLKAAVFSKQKNLFFALIHAINRVVLSLKIKPPRISLPKIPLTTLEKPKSLAFLLLLKLKLWLIRASKFRIKLPRIRQKPILFATTFLLGITLFGFATWWLVLRDLPSPNELVTRELEVSTKIYDREGKLLYKIYKDKNRTLVPLQEIPLEVRLATIAIEDAEFYTHPGFSIKGILRATIRNIRRGELSGGSTITQQLVKNALLSSEKTLVRKLRELVLAIAVEFSFSKDEILEMYLNEVSYGGTAYGIQEASRVYFGKDVNKLSLAEASLLAGLPKSPTRHSPFGPNPELSRQRQKEVVSLMVANGFINKKQAEEVLNHELKFAPNRVDIEAPHFVMYVREKLAEEFGEELVGTGGLEVVTTLDYSIQKLAERVVSEEIKKIRNLNVTNGAALVVNTKTGEILAMVGSKDYFDLEADGNVNVTVRPRQPGSAIKIVNYAYALSNGYTPATILADTPVTFSVAGQPPYSPKNYDGKFRGNLSLRNALAESRNVPAVKVLASYGVKNMIEMGQKMGITTWNDPSRYGLSLTLGGGEVKLIDLARAYTTLANYGRQSELSSILKVANYKGKVLNQNECILGKADLVEEVEAAGVAKLNCEGEQVLDSRVAFLLIDILKDNDARAPSFGSFSQLVIPNHNEVAVKTGTSNDLRDNWTIGFNQDYLVAVWVGNNDNSPMARVASGVTGASPIFNKIMSALLAQKPNDDWPVPPGLVQVPVCTLTGTLSCEGCPTRVEWFLEENQPKTVCRLEEIIKIEEEKEKLKKRGRILEPAARTER
ncbi:penicillin-binding protein 1C [Patescibacteria group bacterium]|nr:penicillin-binding protein 1C [Patescibacteria group bacterium]